MDDLLFVPCFKNEEKNIGKEEKNPTVNNKSINSKYIIKEYMCAFASTSNKTSTM